MRLWGKSFHRNSCDDLDESSSHFKVGHSSCGPLDLAFRTIPCIRPTIHLNGKVQFPFGCFPYENWKWFENSRNRDTCPGWECVGFTTKHASSLENSSLAFSILFLGYYSDIWLRSMVQRQTRHDPLESRACAGKFPTNTNQNRTPKRKSTPTTFLFFFLRWQENFLSVWLRPTGVGQEVSAGHIRFHSF